MLVKRGIKPLSVMLRGCDCLAPRVGPYVELLPISFTSK